MVQTKKYLRNNRNISSFPKSFLPTIRKSLIYDSLRIEHPSVLSWKESVSSWYDNEIYLHLFFLFFKRKVFRILKNKSKVFLFLLFLPNVRHFMQNDDHKISTV